MGDRRKLLGTGAVLVGVGTALFSANGVAAADTEPDTATPQADSPAPTAPTRAHRGANRAKAAPAPAAATNDSPAPTVRSPRPAAATRVTAPKNSSPVPQVSVPTKTPLPSSATPAPSAATTVTDTVTPAPAPVAQAAPATVITTPLRTSRGAGIQTVATTAPAATAAAAVAPVKAFLNDVLSALGWGPAGAPVAATPALGAFTGQRASVTPAAVVGTAAAAAAPPDPTPQASLESVQGPAPDAKLPGYNNGVTGVKVGHSRLEMPGAFFGDTVAADWYIPTQADGSVQTQGVIYLQHGFGASNTFYSALAKNLAMKTNSIVVAPTLSSIPFTLSGGCLVCSSSQEAAAGLFLQAGRTKLVASALDAGLDPDFASQVATGKFAVAGHSAGGGFATAMASDYINDGSEEQDTNLVGVLMYDGVSNNLDQFKAQVTTLKDAGKPVYTIAAPAQAWNAFGGTTNALLEALGDEAAAEGAGTFAGVVLTGGSHIDSMLGVNPLFDGILQLVSGRSPAGNTSAVYTLGNGWINDMYQGYSPSNMAMLDLEDPAGTYGFYAGANEAIIMGPTSAWALPSPVANQLGLGDQILTTVIDTIGGLFGFSILPDPQVNFGKNGVEGVIVPTLSNGVTGVRTGSSSLQIPSGEGYNAPADWYFPTQADGSVQANGVIWLQHGFLGFKDWYAVTAQSLAQETNSIVVVPNIFWFDDAFTGVAAAQMFLGSRPELNVSANAAGFQGVLPEKFLATGHSAGGRFATTLASTYVDLTEEDPQRDNLLGVVMFDGVSRPPTFVDQLQNLKDAGIPDYQIGAPPQRWNAWDIASETMVATFPGEFVGLQIINGSHTDVIDGFNLFGILGTIASDIIVRQSPPGAKEAVRTLANGWINDFYDGRDATNPFYGLYGNPNDGTYVPNQFISMGQATAATLPSPPPVDINQYAGTWYEQGSVPQFFSIGLVNTSATYTPQPDGSVKVENSGNYFFNNGPQSSITGSAVPVNAFNTRLNVGFFFGEPGTEEPGNYWILDYAPDYSYAIVSDPSLFSGYILTRDKIISDAEYDALLDRAKLLGIRGPILRTKQFPVTEPGAALPGPSAVPASVAV